jgi:hypothetical protein
MEASALSLQTPPVNESFLLLFFKKEVLSMLKSRSVRKRAAKPSG